jgi:hypothetical protein
VADPQLTASRPHVLLRVLFQVVPPSVVDTISLPPAAMQIRVEAHVTL